jgi:hypothetical protein
MKKCLLLMSLFLLFVLKSNGQMGIGTTSPDSSAMLDVTSANKGFLPPRIALTATNVAAPVKNPAEGLLIYNTATNGTGSSKVTPGYYYWNGTQWQAVVNKGNAPGDMQYWNGSQWVSIPAGANGSVLTLCNGVPRWGGCSDSLLVLRPINNPNEGYAYSYFPNSAGNGIAEFMVAAWTHNSTPSVGRSFLRFDYSLPAGATILSAKLSLYAVPNPNSGNLVDAHSGANNAMYIQRVTSYWTGTTATWNNQPSVTPYNQVTVPTTTSSFQNDTDIDVTQLVKDMQQFGNNGFALQLVSENYYNIRQYASSFHTDTTKHPKLVITFR